MTEQLVMQGIGFAFIGAVVALAWWWITSEMDDDDDCFP